MSFLSWFLGVCVEGMWCHTVRSRNLRFRSHDKSRRSPECQASVLTVALRWIVHLSSLRVAVRTNIKVHGFICIYKRMGI